MSLLELAIDELGKIESFDALNVFARQICDEYKIENLAFQVVSPNLQTDKPIFMATYEQTWIQQYVCQDYFKIDPVVCVGSSSFLPLDWDDIDRSDDRMQALFNEAASYGVGHRGLTIPIRGPSHEKSLLTITTYDSPRAWARRRAITLRDFLILAHFLHDRCMTLVGLRSEMERKKLSLRERECVERLARGLAPKQIAYDLDLSVKTVRAYLLSARLKLGAVNTNETIALAVRDEHVLI